VQRPGAPRALPPAEPNPYRFESDVICPFCEITPDYPTGRRGLHWHSHWRSAGTREWITMPLLLGGIVGVRFAASPSVHANWRSPILFDTAVRDGLRIRSPRGRKTASLVSDSLFVWEVVHPTIIDPFIVAWWHRQSPYVAWQMFVIDAQAYGLTILASDIVKRVVARERPWVETCETDPRACNKTSKNHSFFSGHSAVTATGAGLLCAHHTQLNLYQSDLLDQATCVLAVLGTATTGAMRIASDNHWTSDVLIGHLTGYTSGYLLPTLLYYKEFSVAPHDHESPAPVYATLPLITRDALGLQVIGAF
jgi:membrane-associated phospholipid phosphatase